MTPIKTKEMLTMMGLLIVILFVSQVGAMPETFYYTGKVDLAERWTGGYCIMPPNEHFQQVPGGVQNYKLWVVDTVVRHYGPADMFITGKGQLGKSKAEQERMEFNKYFYCYTIPDYEWVPGVGNIPNEY